jgi:hypothetical protein
MREANTAEDYSNQAVGAYTNESSPDWAFGDAAGSRASLAIGRVYPGEVDGAADALASVLELQQDRHIRGIVSSDQHVHDALAPSGADGAAALDLQEEIEVFARTPVKALPH